MWLTPMDIGFRVWPIGIIRKPYLARIEDFRSPNLWRLGKLIHGFHEKAPRGCLTTREPRNR